MLHGNVYVMQSAINRIVFLQASTCFLLQLLILLMIFFNLHHYIFTKLMLTSIHPHTVIIRSVQFSSRKGLSGQFISSVLATELVFVAKHKCNSQTISINTTASL